MAKVAPRKVGILVFDDVEILDFSGPYEVFGATRHPNTLAPLFDVVTVADKPTGQPVTTRNGMRVLPTHGLDDCPHLDLLLVPGGLGARTIVGNARVVDWVRHRAVEAELVISVCTGSFILAKAGLLKPGMGATTYHLRIEELAALAPGVRMCKGERFVDNGKVITSAGIASGIDVALYVVGRLCGDAQAHWTARVMEYEHYVPKARL
eukprot:TRINITY_DN18389_c0_g1_i1.p1 TRINITY_DN18389_c0_g1~~TRINITY_DN18389_c0_g1_i1.p1  ORF type:complete len:223 (-),score=60.47 TRINITY_DN18389_c0_g1_i1:73-696(-)